MIGRKTIFGEILGMGLRLLFSCLSSSLIVFIAGDILVMLMIVVTGSSLEKILFWIIAHTPVLNINDKANFSLRTDEVVKVFIFWALILTVIGEVLKRFFRVKSLPIAKRGMVFLAVIHLTAFVRLSKMSGSTLGSLGVITLFYGVSLLSWFWYRRIKESSTFFNKILE